MSDPEDIVEVVQGRQKVHLDELWNYGKGGSADEELAFKLLSFVTTPLDAHDAKIISIVRSSLLEVWWSILMRWIRDSREFMSTHSDEECYDRILDIIFKKEGEYPYPQECNMGIILSLASVKQELKKNGIPK